MIHKRIQVVLVTIITIAAIIALLARQNPPNAGDIVSCKFVLLMHFLIIATASVKWQIILMLLI